MKKVVVIGAGILGASTAYHLAKLGAKVTVVDRIDKGQATDAAAGIICPWISQRRNKAWYTLVKNGASYYPKLIQQLLEDGQAETGYNKVGAISLHTDPDKLEKMKERALKRRADAPEIGEVTILTPAQTKSLYPVLSDEYGSVFISGGAKVDGRKLKHALIQAATKHSVTFVNGNASLIMENNILTGVAVNKEQIVQADQVVVTAGAWAKELFEPIGVNMKVVPQKAQIVHLQLENNQETNQWPVVMPPNNQYMLSFEDGRIVVGATHEDEAGFDSRVTAGAVHEILNKALVTAPDLAEATLLETRVGFRPFTPNFLPIIGKLPNFEGIFLANGLGASGLTSGPYLGAELAKLVVTGETELELSQYDVSGAID
ncbi:Hydrogen cyanide synthase subunit HcnC precursor [Bacillus sp. THAF10]|uniref:NAD(P)/FAD-dependent oxidoreductase n=1 Tax=Bacillus sp. THAF10 TaxID=2587848 RepID=UPI00126837C5|nr:FAD-dependent oxidoreductase [Bacillus sp. THAF10]QFT89099.1 Hydrogen cyanide synthase subunit HcnC precursor [Bacillus sp. THAF10]